MNKKGKLRSVKNKDYKNIDEIFDDIEYGEGKLSSDDYIHCLFPALIKLFLIGLIAFPISVWFLSLGFSKGSFIAFLIFFIPLYSESLYKQKKKKKIIFDINKILLSKANKIHPLENVSDIHEYKKILLSQKT